MKSIAITQTLAAVLLLGGVAGAAATLKPFQAEAKEKFEKEIAARVKRTNEKCGTNLSVKINFESYDKALWSGYSVSDWCANSLSSVARLCETPAYKDAIAKRITEVHCLFGGQPATTNEQTQANFSVNGKAFVYKMNTDSLNAVINGAAVLEQELNK